MMQPARRFGLGSFFVATALLGSVADASEPSEMLQRLLALPSPAKAALTTDLRRRTPPDPDDLRAGNELALLGFWASDFSTSQDRSAKPPTEALLRAVAAHPSRLPNLLETLPSEPGSILAVKELYDRSLIEPWSTEHWKSTVHDWLMMHTEYFREDLVEAARHAIDTEGYVEGSDRLEALAKLDWEAAAPILQEHARGSAPRTAALALTILYQRARAKRNSAVAEDLRLQLQRVAEDPNAPGRAVNSAIEALLQSDWKGRDDWYFRLMEDPALGDLSDDSWGFTPLSCVVEKDPDLWIPRIAQLVGGPNRILHDQAVGILIRFNLERAREDALRPLLPWISDPAWADAPDRLRLIQSVDGVGLREAIPSLILALESGDEWGQYIADTLGGFRAREATPALRVALHKEKDFLARQAIIKALLEVEGFSNEELADAIERYAEQSSTQAGRDAIFESRLSWGSEGMIDLPVQIGQLLSRSKFLPSEPLATALLARLAVLEVEKPRTAEALEHLLAGWSSQTLDQHFVAALVSGDLDAWTVAELLRRREDVRAHSLGPLRKALLREGAPRGIGAILLGEARAVRQALQGGSPETRVALFAGARIVDEVLPLSLVKPLLLGSDPSVSAAAERYLETNDGPAEREMLWKKYSGRAWILGHSSPGDPDDGVDPIVAKSELGLRQELFRADGPREIFAWIANAHWAGRSRREIRFAKEGSTLTCESGSRPLSAAESAALLNFVTQRSVDDLGYFRAQVSDCNHAEYLHLTRERGRRVAMYCPGFGFGSDHSVLEEIFLDIRCPESLDSKEPE